MEHFQPEHHVQFLSPVPFQIEHQVTYPAEYPPKFSSTYSWYLAPQVFFASSSEREMYRPPVNFPQLSSTSGLGVPKSSTPVLVEVRSSCETADFKRDVIWKNFKLSVNAVGKTRAKTYWRLCESQSRKIQVETFLFDIWPAREWWLRRMIIATAVRWTSVAAIDSE